MKRVRTFVLLFLPIFAVGTAIYLPLRQAYQRVVVAAANQVLDTFTFDVPIVDKRPGLTVDVVHDLRLEITLALDTGGWIVKQIKRDGTRRDFYFLDPAGMHLIYLNIVLFPALLLATPELSRRRRFITLGVGVILLFVLHVVAAVVLVRTKAWVTYNSGDWVALMMRSVFTRSGQLFAVIFWAISTWQVWLPRQEQA